MSDSQFIYHVTAIKDLLSISDNLVFINAASAQTTAFVLWLYTETVQRQYREERLARDCKLSNFSTT